MAVTIQSTQLNNNLFYSFTDDAITEVLRYVVMGEITEFAEAIENISKVNNPDVELAELFNNLNFTNNTIYKPSDFIIKDTKFGKAFMLPNKNINEQNVLIRLNTGRILLVQNEIGEHGYVIDLYNVGDGPIDCIERGSDIESYISSVA